MDFGRGLRGKVCQGRRPRCAGRGCRWSGAASPCRRRGRSPWWRCRPEKRAAAASWRSCSGGRSCSGTISASGPGAPWSSSALATAAGARPPLSPAAGPLLSRSQNAPSKSKRPPSPASASSPSRPSLCPACPVPSSPPLSSSAPGAEAASLLARQLQAWRPWFEEVLPWTSAL